MNDLIPICRYEGKITKGDLVITDKGADLVELRKSIGMVFQRPIRSRNPSTKMWPMGSPPPPTHA